MRAILSVYDKTQLQELAAGLTALGVELFSTGGTKKALEDARIPVRAVEDLTGFPEMMDGRVKTLHPAVHGGILARRDVPQDMAQLQQHGFCPVDMVVGNLYPFRGYHCTTRRCAIRCAGEHRHRRADNAARGCQEPPQRVGSHRPPGLRAGA